MKIKPIIVMVKGGKETAQALAAEYRWMGRNAEAKGDYVVAYPTEYTPPKRRRGDDD